MAIFVIFIFRIFTHEEPRGRPASIFFESEIIIYIRLQTEIKNVWARVW